MRLALPRSATFALTLALGLAGGAAANALGLPVAWLLGPVLVVSAASLAGLDTRLPARVRDFIFVILGMQAGSGVTPEVLNQVAIWPLSFAIQMIGVLGVIGATYTYLRVLKWDKQTALFAAIPGALSFVLAAASETRADITRVTVLQSIRLLLLIGALTPALALLEGGEGAVAMPHSDDGVLLDYVILFGTSFAAAFVGHRSRLPGGMMLGALLASAVLHGTGIAAVRIPPVLAIPALVLLGIMIGSRLRGVGAKGFLKLLPASLGSFAIGLGVSAISAGVAVLALGLGTGKVALAYAPGALEALTVLAFQFGLDPAYVAAHHVVRFMCLALMMPLLATFIATRAERDAIARTSVLQGDEEYPSGVDRGED